MKVAIQGGGISRLAAALFLHGRCEQTAGFDRETLNNKPSMHARRPGRRAA